MNKKDGDEDIAGCWVIGRFAKLGQKKLRGKSERRISRRTAQDVTIVLCCHFENHAQIGRSTPQSRCCEWTSLRLFPPHRQVIEEEKGRKSLQKRDL